MAATRKDIIVRSDDINTRLIDTGVKNPWRWQWLEEKIDGMFLKDVFRKIEKSGFAYCIICCKEISYGSRGLNALSTHVKKEKHLSILETRKKNFALPGSADSSERESSVPYGLHPMFSTTTPSVQKQENPLVPLPDRVANSEAMVLSFLAEKSLPFALAPDLLNLVKELSKDKKALNTVKMYRTTAAYKLRFGVAKTFHDNLIQDLKTEKFSLNIDESTSCNNEKVVTVLVNYCKNDKFVTEHLKSFSVNTVNSDSIFNGVVKIFEENDLPWNNLMSVLLDSCNVMLGKKSGVETKLKEKCPHLLDIDGDSCHHAHNAAKQFCKPFNSHLESLFQDIHSDFKWSPDLRVILKEVCDILGIKFTVPQNYISYRWLSVYDVAQDFSRLYDAFIVFYFSFLNRADKLLWLHEVVKIYKKYKIKETARDHLHKLQATLAAKKLTEAGNDRKLRITNKLFVSNLQTKLTLNLYLSVLPLLKEYITLFQSHTPLIHKLHDKQLELLKGFLCCFIKPECLKPLGDSPGKIKMLDVENVQNHLPIKSIFIGDKAKDLIYTSSKASQFHIKSFQTAYLKAYISCSQSLLAKMPILNPFLQTVSAIDPMCRQTSLSLKFMKRLPQLVRNVILDDEKELFELEVQSYHADELLSQLKENDCTDEWWIVLKKSSNYPLLTKMACALLTCFHGPRVESSFSIMNTVITPGTSRLNIETFDAIQSIKYHLMAEKKSATTYFAKKEFLHDPVEKNLVNNMISASKSYNNEKLKKQIVKRNKMINLKQVQEKAISKKKAKKLCANAVKMQRLKHMKNLKRKSTLALKSRLDLMFFENKEESNSSVTKGRVASSSKSKGTKESVESKIDPTNEDKNKNFVSVVEGKSTIKRKDLAEDKKTETSTSKTIVVKDGFNEATKKRGICSKVEGCQRKKQKPLTIKEMFERKMHKG